MVISTTEWVRKQASPAIGGVEGGGGGGGVMRTQLNPAALPHVHSSLKGSRIPSSTGRPHPLTVLRVHIIIELSIRRVKCFIG